MLTFNFAEIQSPMLFQKHSTNLHSKKKNASAFQVVVNKKSTIHYRQYQNQVIAHSLQEIVNLI